MNRLATLKPRISKRTTPKVLTLDIETRPNEAYVWGLWKQNIGLNQLMQHGHVMCFVAKWYDQKDPIFRSDYHDGHDTMVKAAWDLLDQADIVVTYNGASFDIPHLNREFALAGLIPPSPYRQVDLIKTVRAQFNFASNKLANVVEELGVGGKMSTGGFDLWADCIANNPAAWDKMRRYNTTDVRITERLYDRLRPWIKGHPHLGLWADNTAPSCPNCGHAPLHPDAGSVKTHVQAYPAYTCPKCGTRSRGTTKTHAATGTRAA